MDIVERCRARAALAGNPSDGYGGAVVAVPIPALFAEVRVAPGADFAFHTTEAGTAPHHFRDIAAVVARAASIVPDDDHALAVATVAEVAQRWGAPPDLRLTVDSSIPRSVGLAGSSAIVIATLRALLRASRRRIPDPAVIASVAHAVEVNRLGIDAGLQDRVVQAYDQPMVMRFGPDDRRHVGGFDMGSYTPTTLLSRLPVLVAWQASASAPSQSVHGDLSDRFRAGEPSVLTTMNQLAQQADFAAVALADNDRQALGRAMDATFDLRASMIDLQPAHVALVETARSVGASANYTGSGGAVIVLATDLDMLDAADRSLQAIGATTLLYR